MSKRFGKDFDENVRPRPGLLDALQLQLGKEDFRGKTIHLCFMCDPYPAPPVDTMITRHCISLLKQHGCHVQLLTKGGQRAERDFDLLDSEDWFGISYAGYSMDDFDVVASEPNTGNPMERLHSIVRAKALGMKTWVSFEPVIGERDVLYLLENHRDRFDMVKIGKLNYAKSDFDLATFGRKAEEICIAQKLNYNIKKSLRAIMEAVNG